MHKERAKYIPLVLRLHKDFILFHLYVQPPSSDLKRTPHIYLYPFLLFISFLSTHKKRQSKHSYFVPAIFNFSIDYIFIDHLQNVSCSFTPVSFSIAIKSPYSKSFTGRLSSNKIPITPFTSSVD